MDEDDTSVTLPKHIFGQLKLLIDPAFPAEERKSHCETHWLPNLQEQADAYITFSGDVHRAHLPAFYSWNSTFRKAYTILFWIRPRIGDEMPPKVDVDSPPDDSHRRVLYRMATDANDANGTGVCVTCSQWKILSGGESDGKSSILQTTLTAFALPFSNPSKMAQGGFMRAGSASSTNFSSWTQQTLELAENSWHLVGCSHVYPYLKRPVWTVSVDGKSLAAGATELHYPVLQETRKSQGAMEDCQIFQNITAGGAQMVVEEPAMDDQKTASQLQAEATGSAGPVFSLMIDLASLSVYNEQIPLNVQAILADSGPVFAQQQHGVCTLPPVPNWTKGCSLSAGPKVGIPLTVHALALEVQRLSGSLQFSASAASTRVLGGSTAPSARFSCPYHPQVGQTGATPRVGLIQPQPTAASDDDESVVLYISGDCSLTDVLSTYLLHHGPENLFDWTNQYTKNWSLAWGQQNALMFAVLPFFLALTPPDASWMKDSCRQLFALYSDGGFSSALIRMLAALIRTGGSRIHEEVLQNGILHILSSSLRLGLVRAHKLRLSSAKSVEEFLQRVPAWDDLSTLVSPPGVDDSISEAVVDLLDACCGPDAKSMNELSPCFQIRRTSDLALTAVFGLGLDWDLWVNAKSHVVDSIARKYGGACITSGYVFRSQISVQHLLDGSSAMKHGKDSLSQLLLGMMLSSLTNTRSITQSEKDTLALIGALTEASLSSTTADVILNVLVGVLVWCEVLPSEAANGVPHGADEEEKVQVAGRLGRNLMIGQFHDVVAPVLLSRTVFSGDTSVAVIPWHVHWQKCLLVYSWLASIAGPEGVTSAESTGSLMLASSLAGSLSTAMADFDLDVASTLFLPSPNMALWIGASFRNEWSYKDLLADRLHIMMPLLPAMVVSMVSQESQESHLVLSKILQSVCGALERVFGGVMHSAGRRPLTKASGSSDTIQAAKSYVPHLLVIGMVLEKNLPLDTKSPVLVEMVGSDVLPRDKMTESESWVASTSTDDLAGEIDLTPTEDSVAFLRACQKSMLRTAGCLMVHSMSLGGAGVALSLLNIVVSTLNEPTFYQTPDEKTTDVSNDSDNNWANTEALNVMCRVVADVIGMSLKREQHWEVWGYEMSSAMSKVCLIVEEKGLLEGTTLSNDQIVLLNVLVDILIYGRDSAGWCQLTLPPLVSAVDVTANSKALLPTLRPCLRTVLRTLEQVPPSTMIEAIPCANMPGGQVESLLHRMATELDATITAAIVGLAFVSAREIALEALANLRKATRKYNDEKLRRLLVKIADELTVRYQSERRLRGNALFDAYEDDPGSNQNAAKGSMAVENLILGGGGLFGQPTQAGFDEPNEQDDFVVFPSNEDSREGVLGFESLRGLSMALENWKKLSHDSEDAAFDEAIDAFSPFLDIWDARGGGEIQGSDKVNAKQSSSGVHESVSPLPVLGSATAADAMSTFFEIAATEKNRRKEVALRILPSIRSSRVSFAERVCWSRFSAIAGEVTGCVWERAVSDGNRDIRSRLATLPCSSQFSKYLPKYLDMSAEKSLSSDNKAPSMETEVGGGGSEVIGATTPTEIDKLTKNLLETGNVEIVDITKKEIEDSADPDPLSHENMDQMGDMPDLYDEDFSGANGLDSANTAEENAEFLEQADDVEGENKIEYSDSSTVGYNGFTTSSFSTPPDNATSSLGLMQSAAASMIELHIQNCTHVKPEGNRQCTLLLTASHLILEYDGHPDGYFEGEILAMEEEADRQRRIAEDTGNNQENEAEVTIQRKDEKRQRTRATMRPKSIRWNLSEISHIYLRRYRLRDSSLEVFVIPTGGTSFGSFGLFSPASSLFIDFGAGRTGKARRDSAASNIMRRAPPQAVKQWPERSEQFLYEQLSRVTLGWAEGRISNFDYLLHLNILSGRSYNDICQYPVFPWVLADYTSEEIPSLTDPKNFRDLSKPVGALNPERLKDFVERFNTFADPSIPPFMYGSHYSTSAGVVLHFLVRLHPFAGLHRQLQGGHFDVADRLFSSVPRTWSMCTGSSAAEVKEITPEWYCNPSFLRNDNNFLLGTSQDGEKLGDVALPPWARNSAEKFIEVMRAALESDICSDMIPDWIDLIFGRKQQGPEAIEANNVFFYLTYYGTVDVASIEDEALRQATELQIAHFGQCPMQLFRRPHVRRIHLGPRSYSFYQVVSAYFQLTSDRPEEESDGRQQSISTRALLHSVFGEPYFLPFSSAPISHWVHSCPPPPGPHSALMAIRLAGTDRCLAIDGRGIYHFFRWAWRPEESQTDLGSDPQFFDRGCFVAQRELPRFRVVPRLMRSVHQEEFAAVAISKTLFANRSVLLILSDADGMGSLGMQLVDPSKGEIKGEVVVPQVHSGKIISIATDPTGHGGVGGMCDPAVLQFDLIAFPLETGEIAIVGSADGNASLWRFMSSHYLPLRPRACLSGHEGSAVVAVALSSSIHVAVTLSTDKCCVHSTGNGVMSRFFRPPQNVLDLEDNNDLQVVTTFARSSALAISVQGFIVTVCESSIEASNGSERSVVTLNLFTIEGLWIGSKPLESWRGVPSKMHCTPDGTTLIVCCGRGVTFHRISACQPLEFIDEFQISESDDLMTFPATAAFDIDFGPALNRPVLAAAACSYGELRLHALPGISAWSERYKKSGLSQTVGSALATPARRFTSAVRDGLGFGQKGDASDRGFFGLGFKKS